MAPPKGFIIILLSILLILPIVSADIPIVILKNQSVSVVNVNSSVYWGNLQTPANINLNDLGDVVVPSPSNGQVLFWNSTSSKWEATSLSLNSGNVTSITRGYGINLTGTSITSSGTIDINSSVFQVRILGTCAAGTYLQSINIDGTVNCGIDAGNASFNKSYTDTLYASIIYGYNQSDGSYNITYAGFAYNQTTAGQQYFLNLSGTNANQNLNISNATQNFNVTASWFLGKFNWVIATVSSGWLTFDGTTLTFNETRVNATIDARATNNASWNETRANLLYSPIIWGYNQTYTGGTFNQTYQNFAYNQTYLGGTYNVSYNNLLNQSGAGQFVNGTLPNGTLQFGTPVAIIPINGTRLTISNITNFDYNYNQSDGSYNVTYAQWAYNQTVPANTYTDTSSTNLQSNISAVNTSLKIQIDNKLNRNGTNANENINIGLFNFTGNYSFFDYVGSSLRRTIKGWFTDLDISNNLSVGGNVSALRYYGDGSTLSNLPGNASWNKSYADTLYSGIEWDYNQTTVNNGITLSANNVTTGIFPGQNNFTNPQIFNANITIRNFDSIVLNQSNKYIRANETCSIIVGPTSRLELC